MYCGSNYPYGRSKVLDIFIIFGTILALIFLFAGKKLFSGWAYFLAAFLFLVIGMGIFVTGYQTYDNAPITITETTSTVSIISFELLTTNPVLEGTPDQQIVFVFAIFYIVLTLILVFMSIEQSMANKAAKETEA